MSSPKNLEYKKTSFLNKANSAFIEEMYVKFINKDPSLSESWIEYFSGVDEDMKILVDEINGPSWKPFSNKICLLYTSPSPRDSRVSRMPSSA